MDGNIVAIRAAQEIRIIDKTEFDSMFNRAFPASRYLQITLSLPAVYKDGVFFIAEGSLQMLTKEKS